MAEEADKVVALRNHLRENTKLTVYAIPTPLEKPHSIDVQLKPRSEHKKIIISVVTRKESGG